MKQPKEQEIMDFLQEHVFDPILLSPRASEKLKQGVRLTITRMNRLDAAGMVQYYWSAIICTERSIGFAARMRKVWRVAVGVLPEVTPICNQLDRTQQRDKLGRSQNFRSAVPGTSYNRAELLIAARGAERFKQS